MKSFEGRNEVRFNNSGGRCLLENWVEEVFHGKRLLNIMSYVLCSSLL